VYPFPYEFRRITIVLITAMIIISISFVLNISPWIDFFVKILLFLLFPTLLILTGFLFCDEKSFLKKELNRFISLSK